MTLSHRRGAWLCVIAMAALAAAVLVLGGVTPLTVALAAVAAACPLAAYATWRMARRAQRSVETATGADRDRQAKRPEPEG